jgi:hypothetical protein
MLGQVIVANESLLIKPISSIQRVGLGGHDPTYKFFGHFINYVVS